MSTLEQIQFSIHVLNALGIERWSKKDADDYDNKFANLEHLLVERDEKLKDEWQQDYEPECKDCSTTLMCPECEDLES